MRFNKVTYFIPQKIVGSHHRRPTFWVRKSRVHSLPIPGMDFLATKKIPPRSGKHPKMVVKVVNSKGNVWAPKMAETFSFKDLWEIAQIFFMFRSIPWMIDVLYVQWPASSSGNLVWTYDLFQGFVGGRHFCLESKGLKNLEVKAVYTAQNIQRKSPMP